MTESVTIPTIGIGAGMDCDGQVLVCYDMLGLNDTFRPRFVKRYEQLAGRVRAAVNEYVGEVKDQLFPTEEFSFGGEQPRSAFPGVPMQRAAAVAEVIDLACGWPRPVEDK